MRFDDLDTSKCLIDPKSDDLLLRINAIPEFAVGPGVDLPKRSVARYIILMYDSMSPLWREVRHFPLRKAFSASLAGFNKSDNGRFSTNVEDIFEGKNANVNSMIAKYISMQNNPRWSQLVAYEAIYFAELTRITSGDFGKTNDMLKAIDTLSDKMNDLIADVVGGEGEAVSILDAVYGEAAKGLDLSCEKIADYLSGAGNVPDLWNPYNTVDKKNKKVIGEPYVVDQIRFLGDA